MRIVIAEDELIERKALKKLIEDNIADMEVVGEAANGRMAIELAKSKMPDIMFMDIKMPGINGLEAIERIHKINPDIKFILVSAYDSFDFAKEAMQYGIKHYILKPEKNVEIIEALLQTKREIEEERQETEAIKQSEFMMKDYLLNGLMKDPVPVQVVEQIKKEFPSITCCWFMVVRSKVNGINKKVNGLTDEVFLYTTDDDQHTFCFLAKSSWDKADQLRFVRILYEKLQQEAAIGIGEICQHVQVLPQSYQQAYVACLQHNNHEKRGYGFSQSPEIHPGIIKEIHDEVVKGHGDQAIALFKKYDSLFKTTRKEDLYMRIKQSLKERNLELNTTFTSIQTVSDWQLFLQVSSMKMSNYYHSRQYKTQVENYIEAHFNEPLRLEQVAEAVQLSPNYFSNLFKEEFGENFSEYLTKIRMEKAKQLIEKNEFALKEIAFKVGYRDPNYFSRVFKRYFHESPTAYQRRIFG